MLRQTRNLHKKVLEAAKLAYATKTRVHLFPETWLSGPGSLAVSLEPLTHYQNVATLSLFYRYYFGRCSSELAELVPLPYSQVSSTHYSDRLYDFSALDVTRMSMSTVSSLAQLDSGILCL